MTLVRVGLGAAALTPFGLAALRGRWGLLRRNLGLLAGLRRHRGRGRAVLLLLRGPAHAGRVRRSSSSSPRLPRSWSTCGCATGSGPVRMTLAGAGLAALGLVLVLDLVSGADLSVRGVLWALGAMVGCATYFIISADEDNGLPPLVLAWGGLLVGALGARRCSGLVGVLPLRASTDDARRTPARTSRGGSRCVGPGPGHRRAVLRRGHRCRPPARLPAGVVRRAARGGRERLLGLAAARRAARARSSCSAGC